MQVTATSVTSASSIVCVSAGATVQDLPVGEEEVTVKVAPYNSFVSKVKVSSASPVTSFVSAMPPVGERVNVMVSPLVRPLTVPLIVGVCYACHRNVSDIGVSYGL